MLKEQQNGPFIITLNQSTTGYFSLFVKFGHDVQQFKDLAGWLWEVFPLGAQVQLV